MVRGDFILDPADPLQNLLGAGKVVPEPLLGCLPLQLGQLFLEGIQADGVGQVIYLRLDVQQFKPQFIQQQDIIVL